MKTSEALDFKTQRSGEQGKQLRPDSWEEPLRGEEKNWGRGGGEVETQGQEAKAALPRPQSPAPREPWEHRALPSPPMPTGVTGPDVAHAASGNRATDPSAPTLAPQTTFPSTA